MNPHHAALVAGVLALASMASPALAQSTAFTYQGDLKSGGVPANGLHDLRFKLFTAATAGTQVGTTQCADNVSVTGGKFTTTIDFGQQFATTAARFLEIEVRLDTGLACANTTGFATLSPRLAMTPVPRAMAASVANALSAPDGSPANAVVVDNAGKVGVGTSVPTHTVHIATTAPTLALQDTDSAGTAGGTQVGYVSYRDSSNTEQAWVGFGSAGDPNFSIVNARPSGDIVLNPFNGNVGIGTASPVSTLDVSGNATISGFVGIGTTTPSSKLSVRGNVQLGTNAELFAAGGQENLRMLRGSINSSGSIDAGSGFTCSRVGTGLYRITFNTPFADTPSVTLSAVQPYNQNPRWATFVQSTSNASLVDVFVLFGNSNPGNSDFHFIAVGPR